MLLVWTHGYVLYYLANNAILLSLISLAILLIPTWPLGTLSGRLLCSLDLSCLLHFFFCAYLKSCPTKCSSLHSVVSNGKKTVWKQVHQSSNMAPSNSLFLHILSFFFFWAQIFLLVKWAWIHWENWQLSINCPQYVFDNLPIIKCSVLKSWSLRH